MHRVSASPLSFSTLFQAGGSRAGQRQWYRATGHAEMETRFLSDGRVRLALLFSLEGRQVFGQGEIRTSTSCESSAMR